MAPLHSSLVSLSDAESVRSEISDQLRLSTLRGQPQGFKYGGWLVISLCLVGGEPERVEAQDSVGVTGLSLCSLRLGLPDFF